LNTDLLSNGVTILLPKNKKFAFQSTKCFQTKDLLAQFCFKHFDFTLRGKYFSKINLAFKKRFVIDLPHKILAKRFCWQK
jgi:hypothetical protein